MDPGRDWGAGHLSINGGMDVFVELLQRRLHLSARSIGAISVARPEACGLVKRGLPAARQRCPKGGLPVWATVWALEHRRNLLKEVLLQVLHAPAHLRR